MPGWLSRNNFYPSDYVHASDLNNLANDNITWGGDVNGGGYHLSNVILQGSGGFSSYVSPIEVTPGSTGTTCLQLDQTVGANHVARWTVCKDATAETGSNTGSNFAVGRYTDAGVVIDTPIAINRATGLITMGAQQWAGAVNGGGQTLSNVVIPGTLADPTTTKGDLLARSASAIARVALGADGFILTADSSQALGVKWAAAPATGVPTSRNIFTGLGLTGGGSLAADLTISGVVMGPSGPTHTAGLVPDAGATVGAARYLREDATWGIPSGAGGGMTDPTTTKGDLIVHGSGTTRLGVGTDGQVLTADSTQTLGVRWGAAATAGSQTPWTSNINGANFALTNVSQIGVGTAAPAAPLHVGLNGNAASGFGQITVQDTANPSTGAPVANYTGIGSDTVRLFFLGCPGSSFGKSLLIWNDRAADTMFGTNGTERMRITAAGNIGIGTAAPTRQLQVTSAAGAATQFNLSQTSTSSWDIQIPASTNALTFSQGGGELMRITVGGNVGIGTPAPRSALSIITATPSTPTTATQLTIGESTNNSSFQVALGYYYAGSSYQGVLQVTAGSGLAGALLLNPSGGNVGIGTAVPKVLLECFAASGGPPATSGASQGFASIRVSRSGGGNVLDAGSYTAPPFGLWLQGCDSSNLASNYPIALNPNGGSVGIGKSAPGYALDVAGDVNCTGAFRVNGTAIGGGGIAGVGWLASGVGVSTRPNCNFTAGGTIGFSVTDVPGSNRVDVFYSVGSDVRLKRNLTPLTGGLDLINRLRPYEFEYNGLGGREEGRRAVSVLAQDLQAIYPQGVTTYPAKLRPEDAETTDLLTFDTLDILFHAALAIQQLSARIETLEKRLKGN